MSNDRLNAAIERIYAALDDPGQMAEIGRDLGRQLGSDAGDIITEEKDGTDIVTWSSHGFDDAFLDSYDAEFLGDNPWFDFIASRAEEGAVSDRMAPGDYGRSTYVNEWIRPQGLGESIGAVLANGRARHSWIGFTRARGARRWSAEEREFLNRLLPHLRRVLRILQRSESGPNASALAQAMNDPILVLDAEGRLVSANASGTEFIDSRHALVDARGRLRLRDHTASDMLLGLVRQTTGRAGGRKSAETDVVIRDGASVVAIASVMPLPSRREVRVVVALRLLDRAPELDLSAIARAFGLTETETALAAAVASGQSVAEFAAARGVSVSTMRWHLKNLEAKTGSNRIDQLVSIIIRAGRPLLRHGPSHVGGAGRTAGG